MVTPLSKLITIENLPLLSKFRGALVGAVVGDCLGAYYENEKVVNLQSLTTFISGLSSENGQLTYYRSLIIATFEIRKGQGANKKYRGITLLNQHRSIGRSLYRALFPLSVDPLIPFWRSSLAFSVRRSSVVSAVGRVSACLHGRHGNGSFGGDVSH